MSLSSSPMDYANKNVLADYAAKLEREHIKPLFNPVRNTPGKNKGFLRTLRDFFPSPFTIGQTIGWMFGFTHAQEYSNYLIENVVKWSFAEQVAAEELSKNSLTWSQHIISWIRSDMAQPGLIEAAKLTLTPTVAPLVTMGLGLAGGLTFTAAAMLIQYLASTILSKRAKDVTIRDLPKLASLIKQKDGKLFVGKNELSSNGLKNVILRINQYALCKELQQMSKSEVKQFFSERTIDTDDGHSLLGDGHILTYREKIIIEEAKDLLSQDNPTHECKSIKKMINLFCLHASSHKNDAFLDSVIESNGKHYLLPNRAKGETLAQELPQEFMREFINYKELVEKAGKKKDVIIDMPYEGEKS